jgi:murein DD-endopeptidase MepM/ murein hydrolase activator NlpD
MAGARSRNYQKVLQDIANEQAARIRFSVSIPPQDYQNQGAGGVAGGLPGGDWRYPLSGKLRVTSPYGVHREGHKVAHTGIDWGAAMGTPIYAPKAGIISSTDFNKIYGNRTILDLGGGIQAMFGHQSKFAVKPGQHVKAGQLIGYVGSTGNSTGPHLHFETWVNGKTVNPLSWFM